jgi:hypothetical protein
MRSLKPPVVYMRVGKLIGLELGVEALSDSLCEKELRKQDIERVKHILKEAEVAEKKIKLRSNVN